MSANIQLTGSPHLKYLNICTPGEYAMDVAIDVLSHLDSHSSITVKNTGWKNGFGLEVCAWVPIKAHECEAELMTDGDTFEVRQTTGSLQGFERIHDLIKSHLKID